MPKTLVQTELSFFRRKKIQSQNSRVINYNSFFSLNNTILRTNKEKEESIKKAEEYQS